MILSEPRPVFVWADMSNIGCSSSFGSPSGHSTNSANLCWLIILDLFFASEWSQRKYPNLNRFTPTSHTLLFVFTSLLTISCWLFVLYNRVFLGKHTLNQIVLGSQLGIWTAFFSHFVLRDSVFSHITKLTHKVETMTSS